jgi:hypothetical protein
MRRTGFSWLRIGSSGGFCKHGDERSDSIKKAGYFLIKCVTISFSNNILNHGVSQSLLRLDSVPAQSSRS